MIAQLLALAALVPQPAGDCISVAQLLSSAGFRHYPAKASRGPWRAPDVRRGTARLFRTRLREDSRGAPDFAGHYKIVQIGCGAGTVCPAIVDKATGHVDFVPAFRSVGWVLSDFAGAGDIERLTYRRNSRLLVLFGMRNEDERTSGVTLYDWRAGKPHLVRFVPAERLCQEDAA
ncbi:MAG: hypothetical protein ABW023_09095 [Sphingomonas sp.]